MAGPLAGLAVAIPALYFGLKSSEIVPASSPTIQGIARIPFAGIDPHVRSCQCISGRCCDRRLCSAAQSTGVCRLAGPSGNGAESDPVGQLDGGHIARALFGTRAGAIVSSLSLTALFLLALFVWPGLMMWAIIIFFMAGRGMPPLNDVSPLPFGRKLLGIAAFVILALILIPMPEGLSSPDSQDMRCPYV